MKHPILSVCLLLSLYCTTAFSQEIKSLPLATIGTFDEIHDIAIGKDSTIWAATASGILFYKNDQFDIKQRIEEREFMNLSAVEVDSSGNVWFSSLTEGVVKFDGVKWTFFRAEDGTINSNEVYSLKIDRKGNLWVGTLIGLNKFDGKKWTSFDIKSGFKNPDISDPIHAIVEDKLGNIYVNNDHCIFKYNGKTWTKLPNSDFRLFGLGIDAKNQLWIFSDKTYIYKEDRYVTVPLDKKLNEAIEVQCMAQEKDGTIWLGTLGKGVIRVKGDEFKLYGTNEGLSQPNVVKIYIAKDGTVWFATYAGLSYYSKK